MSWLWMARTSMSTSLASGLVSGLAWLRGLWLGLGGAEFPAAAAKFSARAAQGFSGTPSAIVVDACEAVVALTRTSQGPGSGWGAAAADAPLATSASIPNARLLIAGLRTSGI